MNFISIYNNDLKGTDVVSGFLEKYFYNNESYFSKYDLINEQSLQIKGVDCEGVFLKNSEIILIDEKCALSYNNIDDLKTYALEVSFLNKGGKLVDGWFLDNKNITSHYLFCWLDKADKKNKDLTLSDIYKVEVMLVSKKSILDYLKNELNLSRDILLVLGNGIRNLNKRKLVIDSNVKFVYSRHLKEKPINLILNKEILRKLSVINTVISNT